MNEYDYVPKNGFDRVDDGLCLGLLEAIKPKSKFWKQKDAHSRQVPTYMTGTLSFVKKIFNLRTRNLGSAIFFLY